MLEPVPSATLREASTPRNGDAIAHATVRYRKSMPSDIDAVAALHADSWRRNYRGAYLDSFLDGDVVAERRAVWTERLSNPGSGRFTVVAERENTVVGFAHTILDDDPEYGALLDNLHVIHLLKGNGIGARLMAETAQILIRSRPQSGLYLWVLEQNTAAQAFYQRRGGHATGRRLGGPFPGGGRAVTLRYAWPSPATLLTEQ